TPGRAIENLLPTEPRDDRWIEILRVQEPMTISSTTQEVAIPIGRSIDAITVLGHVALVGGYPGSGVYSVHHPNAEPEPVLGSIASEYEIVFENRESVRIPLRHGLEILRANDICRWWTTAPRSPFTKPAIRIVKDPSFEILRIDLWEHELDRPGVVERIIW